MIHKENNCVRHPKKAVATKYENLLDVIEKCFPDNDDGDNANSNDDNNINQEICTEIKGISTDPNGGFIFIHAKKTVKKNNKNTKKQELEKGLIIRLLSIAYSFLKKDFYKKIAFIIIALVFNIFISYIYTIR
ncbi:hypothetical protein BCR36DRAFT_409417 [Piromyces finnis]|uniref:Uncharacterized protein n=1 Tax=Piromyces finnis TaxID=1754191 RepID=A0A1Y1VI71_9FUNG|nr:hypothetical protein BCR36DRAFT_409417 [Piromyces finnis]|eukprot:ORX57094.1 hypothetical protein BCR36DRAFT_409417 [Piromyces finnis]